MVETTCAPAGGFESTSSLMERVSDGCGDRPNSKGKPRKLTNADLTVFLSMRAAAS